MADVEAVEITGDGTPKKGVQVVGSGVEVLVGGDIENTAGATGSDHPVIGQDRGSGQAGVPVSDGEEVGEGVIEKGAGEYRAVFRQRNHTATYAQVGATALLHCGLARGLAEGMVSGAEAVFVISRGAKLA